MIQLVETRKRNMDDEGLEKVLLRRIPEGRSRLLDLYRRTRGSSTDAAAGYSPTQLYATIESDRMFRIPAIRLAEAQAALGTPTYMYTYTWQSPMMGGAIGALSGILLAVDQQNVNPGAYLPNVTFILYVIVILGGAGTVWGPVVGALVFQFLFFTVDGFMANAQADIGLLSDLLSPSDAGQIKFVFVGVGLMLLMVFRPQGILGNKKELTFVK